MHDNKIGLTQFKALLMNDKLGLGDTHGEERQSLPHSELLKLTQLCRHFQVQRLKSTFEQEKQLVQEFKPEGRVHVPSEVVKAASLLKWNFLRKKVGFLNQTTIVALKQLAEQSYPDLHVDDINSDAQVFKFLIQNNEGKFKELSQGEISYLLTGKSVLVSYLIFMALRVKQLIHQEQSAFVLMFQAIGGIRSAFSPIIHQLKNHSGQIDYAAQTSKLSKALIEKNFRVQDAYSIRCTSQVIGICKEIVGKALEQSIALANSNLGMPVLLKGKLIPGYQIENQLLLLFDQLNLAINELCSLALARCARIINHEYTQQLPAKSFGLKAEKVFDRMAQTYLEIKRLCKPTSIDSVQTQSFKRDVTSFCGSSCLNTQELIKKAVVVVACEFVLATKAVESHGTQLHLLGDELLALTTRLIGTVEEQSSLKKLVQLLQKNQLTLN